MSYIGTYPYTVPIHIKSMYACQSHASAYSLSRIAGKRESTTSGLGDQIGAAVHCRWGALLQLPQRPQPRLNLPVTQATSFPTCNSVMQQSAIRFVQCRWGALLQVPQRPQPCLSVIQAASFSTYNSSTTITINSSLVFVELSAIPVSFLSAFLRPDGLAIKVWKHSLGTICNCHLKLFAKHIFR